jgi:charged multivesicular body protein 7
MVAILKTVLVLTGCLVLSAFADNLDNLNCSEKPLQGDDVVCEARAYLRYFWSPLTASFVNKPIAMDKNKPPSGKTTPVSDDCENFGDNGVKWYGKRVAYGDKQAVLALYDANDMVAGIQVRYPKSSVNASSGFNHAAVGMFQSETINGVAHWVLTAYFVDPEIICTSGRPASALTTNDGAGDRLVFQNGLTPQDLLVAPRIRQQALQMGYSNNRCFPTMGIHTFFGVDGTLQDCKTIVPVFLLYNKQNYLIGFGFDWVGQNTDKDSFESPPADAIDKIVGGAPKCLLDFASDPNVGITTMHVFFVKRSPNWNILKCNPKDVVPI